MTFAVTGQASAQNDALQTDTFFNMASPHIISLRIAEKYEARYYFKVAKDYFK